jgi:hypothetical protein
VHVDTVHFYKEPLLAFWHNLNIAHSLWDYLLVWLPHWFIFHSQDKFPFNGVISVSPSNSCMTEGTPITWFCQLLDAMNAFGGVPKLSSDVAPKNSTTLNCYERVLTVNQVRPRLNGFHPDTMPNKTVFDEFRNVLFTSLS